MRTSWVFAKPLRVQRRRFEIAAAGAAEMRREPAQVSTFLRIIRAR
jgi:hypothetical protein